MRRHILGIISLLFLAGWIVLLSVATSNDGQTWMLASVCMRAGLVLGALWLALPQVTQLLARYPLWLIGVLCAGVLAIVYRPRLFAPVIAVVAVLHLVGWLFQPPPPRRRRGPADKTDSGR